MRYIVVFILAIALLVTIIGCHSKSGRLAIEREERLNNSHDVTYVHFSGHFVLVNDTIALDKLDSAVFVKQKRGEKYYRYYLAK